MKKQLRQILFLAIFGFLCTVFVFFVPWGNPSDGSEEAVSSAQVKTGSALNPIPGNVEEAVLTGAIRMLVSSSYPVDTLSGFIQNFGKKRGISVDVIFFTGSDFSKEVLSGYDLLLTSYDALSGESFEKISFQEDISSLFIPQLHTFITEHRNFIPLALDPAIMYGLKGLKPGLPGLDVALKTRNPKIPLASFSLGLFSSGSDSFSGRLFDSNLLYAQQLEDFRTFNDLGALKNWLSIVPDGTSTLGQQKLYSLISSSNTPNFSLYTGLLELHFGFYSYFGALSESDEHLGYGVQWYPYQYIGLPSRLYGFAIPIGSSNRQLVDQFLLDYMDKAFDQNIDSLVSGTQMLPVFQNEFAKICAQNSCFLPDELVIIKDAFQKVHQFLEDKLLLKVLEKKVQPDLYLKYASL